MVGDTENFWRGEASPPSHVQAGWFRDSFWGLYKKKETEGGGRQGVGEGEMEGEGRGRERWRGKERWRGREGRKVSKRRENG